MQHSRFAFSVRAPLMILLALTMLLPALPAQPVAAATITVQTLADSGGSVTLRYAIGAAAPGDTIVFQPGLTGTLTLSSTLTLAKNVTIQGPGAASLTINGGCTTCDPGGLRNNGVRVFVVNSGVAASLSGMTITRGRASDAKGGGGILNDGGTLAVMNSLITTNGTSDGTQGGGFTPPTDGVSGGGVANYGTLTVTGSTITNNSLGNGGGSGSGGFSSSGAGGGGGGGIFSPGDLTVTNSTISNNTAGFGGYGGTNATGGGGGGGGGIVSSGHLTVTGSTITGNTTGAGGSGGSGYNATGGAGGNGGNGGGIFSSGSLTVTISTISNNMTGDGGFGGDADPIGGNGGSGGPGGSGSGIFSGTMTMTGSILSGNHTGAGEAGGAGAGAGGTNGATGVGGSGGGFYLATQTATVTGSALRTNSTGGSGSIGGGIANFGTMTVTGSTLNDNTAARGGGGIYNAFSLTIGNVTLSGNIASGISGGGGILNDYALTARNISVVGNNALATGFGGGGIRQAGGTVDIGNSLLIGGSTNGSGADYDQTGGTTIDRGYNFITDVSPPALFTASGNIIGQSTTIGPLADNGGVVTLPDGSHPNIRALTAGSVPVNTGNAALCAASPVNNLDQRGVTRPKGGTCDIGAFELVFTPTLMPTTYTVGTAGGRVTLMGTSLEPVTTVTLGGVAVTTGVVSSAGGTRLSVPIPAHTAGTTVAIVVTNKDTSTVGVNGTLVYVTPNAVPPVHATVAAVGTPCPTTNAHAPGHPDATWRYTDAIAATGAALEGRTQRRHKNVRLRGRSVCPKSRFSDEHRMDPIAGSLLPLSISQGSPQDFCFLASEVA